MKLKDITGIDAYQDICTDENAERYITYIYQDERPVLHGNNMVLADRCEIYVNLYTPVNFDYFELKKKIRDYLEISGFEITSIFTGVEAYDQDTKKIRRTTFDCAYAAFRD
ncbi:MAG: hypothetical protein J6D08_09825 [Lachnospiraceae bacterium]|nr:hypothetical protein [Lachnospiraceae bacterium]